MKFSIRASFSIFNFIRPILMILNPERTKKFCSPSLRTSVVAGFLRALAFLCALCVKTLDFVFSPARSQHREHREMREHSEKHRQRVDTSPTQPYDFR